MIQYLNNISLKDLHSFAIDAFGKDFYAFDSEDDLPELASKLENSTPPLFILGGGSNLLFTKDFEGTIVQCQIDNIELTENNPDDVLVKVGAGVNWDDFVKWTVDQGYYGVENLSLIPGNVGASPVQNIGAYGMEMKDSFESLEGYHLKKKEYITFQKKDCQFDYRSSIFKTSYKQDFIILQVYFRLKKEAELITHYGKIEERLNQMAKRGLAEVRKAIIDERESKLPDPEELPNSGSFFKNPIVGLDLLHELQVNFPAIPNYSVDDNTCKLAAGWLIDQCGWKGKKMGNAAVHDKQALVLVNFNQAKGQEIVELAQAIQQSVFSKFNVQLEPEVNIL